MAWLWKINMLCIHTHTYTKTHAHTHARGGWVIALTNAALRWRSEGGCPVGRPLWGRQWRPVAFRQQQQQLHRRPRGRKKKNKRKERSNVINTSVGVCFSSGSPSPSRRSYPREGDALDRGIQRLIQAETHWRPTLTWTHDGRIDWEGGKLHNHFTINLPVCYNTVPLSLRFFFIQRNPLIRWTVQTCRDSPTYIIQRGLEPPTWGTEV